MLQSNFTQENRSPMNERVFGESQTGVMALCYGRAALGRT